MTDIITLGELLIDLTQSGTDEYGCGKFTAYPGGAPANVAVAASRLGAKTGFIGKVGNDTFGRTLTSALSREGVDTSGLYYSEDVPTTMAIVAVDDEGEREFTFIRHPGADTQLTEEEAIAALKRDTPKILHVGSLSMTNSPSKEACEAAVKFAKENGALISYDPNYREALWESREQAIEMMKAQLGFADLLKVSDEELVMLTGTDDLERGSDILRKYGISLVMITLGSDGVFIRLGNSTAQVAGFKVEVADTNGAGDTFMGAMLAQITNSEVAEGSSWDGFLRMVRYANKAASITCSRHGAMPAMPTARELLGK